VIVDGLLGKADVFKFRPYAEQQKGSDPEDGPGTACETENAGDHQAGLNLNG